MARMPDTTIVVVQIVPIIETIPSHYTPQRHGNDAIEHHFTRRRHTSGYTNDAHQRTREAQTPHVIVSSAARHQVTLIQKAQGARNSRANRNSQEAEGRNDGCVAEHFAEKVRGKHVSGQMPQIKMRKGTGEHLSPGASFEHFSEVAGHGTHKGYPGLGVPGLGLGFGVRGGGEDDDVDAHERVEDGLVSGDITLAVGVVVGAGTGWAYVVGGWEASV
jgi:hypothetical protein